MRRASDLAQACAAAQEARIADGIARVRRAASDDDVNEPLVKVERVIVTGSGDFVAARAAKAALPESPIVRLAERIGKQASVAACAVALLHLWGEQSTHLAPRD